MKTRSKSGGVVLMAMIVAFLLLASCTATPTSPVTPGTSMADTKPSGTLTLAANFWTGVIMDPSGKAVGGGGAFRNLSAAIFDSLVELTPEGQLRPGLAERWEIAPDGLTHIFYIRKGVKFHDGSDLTGADVKFTADTYLALTLPNNNNIAWRAEVATVELRDDYTVVFRLKRPRFELLPGLPALEGTGTVLPKKYIEEKGWDYFARNIVGNGPWKVVSLEPNTRLELEAVEPHWRGVPKFKNLTILNIREEGTKVAMLKTGELDMAMDPSPDSVATLKAAGVRVLSYYGSGQYWLPLHWDRDMPEKYALSDLRVRKALSLAIDRKEVADKIYGGYAQPSAVAWVATTAYFFDPSVLKPDPYDPEQAKKLMAEAGYASGFTTKIWDSTERPTLEGTFLQAVAGYWRKIGVNAELAPIEFGPMVGKFLTQNPGPDVFNTFFPLISSGGVLGFEGVKYYHSTKGMFKSINNPRLDELIEKVPATLDPGEKKRLALEAAVLAKNGYTHIPVVNVDTMYALGPKVGGVTPIKGLGGLAPAYETITHAK